MSLQITSTIASPQGEILTNLYARVAVVNSIGGQTIESSVEFFKDAQSFENGSRPFQLEINKYLSSPYNYGTDNHDILDLGHDLLISFLAEQGITAVKEL